MTRPSLQELMHVSMAANAPLPPPGAAAEGGLAQQLGAPLGIVGEVELGLATLDGALRNSLTAVAVSLCGHTTGAGLRGYTRLQRLRVIVEGGESCEMEPSVSERFNAAVVPELCEDELPALRELHLGRPPRFAPLFPALPAIRLPLLERLVLNEGVSAFCALPALRAVLCASCALLATG